MLTWHAYCTLQAVIPGNGRNYNEQTTLVGRGMDEKTLVAFLPPRAALAGVAAAGLAGGTPLACHPQ